MFTFNTLLDTYAAQLKQAIAFVHPEDVRSALESFVETQVSLSKTTVNFINSNFEHIQKTLPGDVVKFFMPTVK